MATITVKDSAGTDQAIEKPNANGQAAMAGSRPVVIASDQSRVPVDNVVQFNPASPAANTITAGGTAQTLFAANSARRGMAIQNQSSGDLYIAASAALNQTSLKIAPGAYYEVPAGHTGTNIIQIIGATTGQAFWAREW